MWAFFMADTSTKNKTVMQLGSNHYLGYGYQINNDAH
jgi:hypothetical protein